MNDNGTFNPEQLDALVCAIDRLGPESSALLIAARPAIDRALSRGIAKAAIRKAILAQTGNCLSAAQLEKLLHHPTGGNEEEPPNAMTAALLRHPRTSPNALAIRRAGR
jgi:hypothetical protein